MKKVLWISYLYPPLNCGVGRQVKIAKYLPIHGWQPVVLSVKRSRLRPIYDQSMVKDIPATVSVHRTYSLESKLVMQYVPSILHLNPKWVQIPDPFIGWFPFAVREGRRIIAHERVDAIFSSSMPNTCHLVAYCLKRATKLPWIADFRDPWTQNTYLTYPAPVMALEKRMESAVVRRADRITTVDEPIAKDFQRRYPTIPSEKFIGIPHGFDPDDFGNASLDEKPSSQRLTLTYTGSIYGDGKGDALAHAIKDLMDADGTLGQKLHISFVGNASRFRKLCDSLGLQSVVSFSEMVPHEKAVSYMSRSDALLFILGNRELDEKVPTGKLAEYLATGKPILALAPTGLAADMIREADTGTVVDPDDVGAIKQAILELYSKWQSGNLKISPNREFISRYDIRRISAQFASILDEVTRGRSA